MSKKHQIKQLSFSLAVSPKNPNHTSVLRVLYVAETIKRFSRHNGIRRYDSTKGGEIKNRDATRHLWSKSSSAGCFADSIGFHLFFFNYKSTRRGKIKYIHAHKHSSDFQIVQIIFMIFVESIVWTLS